MSFAFPKEIVITKQFQIVNGNNSNQSVTFDPDISSVFSSLEFVNVLNNTFPDAGFVLEDDQYLSEENAKNLFIEKIGGALEGSFNIIGDLDVSGSFSLAGNSIFNGDVDINGNLESNSNFNLGKVLTLYDALNISGGGYKDVNNLNEGFRPILIGNNVNIDSSTKPKDTITIGNFSGLNRSGTQGQRSISIGNYVGNKEQGIGSIGLGYYSAHDTQGNYAVSIGYYDDASGQTNQSSQAVSIGKDAGYTAQGDNAVSIGSSAGKTSQGDFNVAIGANAGKDTQATKAIAIGYNSGTINQSRQSVSIGTSAGTNSQGLNSIAIGTNSGSAEQQSFSIAIGDAAGQNLQGSKSIAIGEQAARYNQSGGSVAIGEQSARYNQSTNSIAIGANSGIGNATDSTKGQAPYCIAIGSNSGTTNQGLATGYSIAIGNQSGETDQGDYSVAIGHQSALTTQGTNSVAIGYLTGRTNQSDGSVAIGEQAANAEQGVRSVAIGSNSGQTSQSTHSIAIGDEAGFDTQGGTTGYSIAIGDKAGKSSQGLKSVAIGNQAGLTSQGGTTGYSIAIGNASGQEKQTEYAIAIGANAGNSNQSGSSIAIGRDAGKQNQQIASIAIGYLSGQTNQNSYSIGLGTQAAFTGQSSYAIAIGAEAGNSNQSGSSIALGYQTGYTSQNTNAVAIGREAGKTSQGANSIAMGLQSGFEDQGQTSIAIGFRAGYIKQGVQGTFGDQGDAIAIGVDAGQTNQQRRTIAMGLSAGKINQHFSSVAIGYEVAMSDQQSNSLAIGLRAGYENQGQNSIAVGFYAGYENQGTTSIAIGNRAGEVDQHANTIILNANTTGLNSSGTSRFYVKPIRNTDTQDTFLRYNATSGEITHHLDLNMPNNGLIKFNNDLSTSGPNKIQLWGNGQYGFGIGSFTVKYSSAQKHTFYYNPSTTNNVATNNGTLGMELDNSNLKVSGKIGINNDVSITPTYELDIKGISHTGSEGFHSGRILHYYPLNTLSNFTKSGAGNATIENSDYVKLTNNDVSITSPSISIRGYTHFKENGTYTANAASNNILGYTSQRILVKLNAQFYSQDGNNEYFSIHLLDSADVQIAEIYKVYNSTQSTSVGFVPIVCDITPYLIENLHNIKIKISSNGSSGDYVLVKNLTICVDDSTPWYNFSAKQLTITDKLSIGNANPSVTLDISATDAIKIPVGTTGQRPTTTTSGSSHYGYIRYNTTNSSYEGFGAGNAWGSLGGVKDVDQDTYISAETSAGDDNDQLKFFTDRIERMIIDSNGKVGIGTNSPSQLLHIYGAQKNFLLQTTNNNQDNNNSILFQNSGTSYSWRIGRRYNSYFNTSNKCNFVISGGNIETDYENLNDRFTIGENGNVGIGTNNPIEKLYVKDGNIIIHSASTNPSLYVMTGGDGTISGTTNFLRAHSTTTNNYIDYKIGNLHFRSNSSGRMTLTAAGNLGIGTDNPTQKLDVRGNIYSTGSGQFTGGNFNSENSPPGVYLGALSSTYGNMQIISSNNNGGWIDFTDNIAGSGSDFDGRIRYGSNVGFDFFTNASTTPRMHIDLAGNVGIGTNAAESKLHINDAPVDNSIDFLQDPTNSTYTHFDKSIQLSRTNDYRDFYIGLVGNNTSNSNRLAFGVNGGGGSDPNIGFTFDANGFVSIGGGLSSVVETSSSSGIQNTKALKAYKSFTNVTGKMAAQIYGDDTSVGECGIRVCEKGTSLTSADSKLFNVLGNGNSKMMVDGIGNVGIGTSSPGAKLAVNGNFKVHTANDDWLLVFRQTMKDGNGTAYSDSLWNNDNPETTGRNVDDPTNPNYSILHLLDSYTNKDNVFHFKYVDVTNNNTNNNNTNEWKQDLNPFDQPSGDSSVQGYQGISTPNTSESWGGFGKTNSADDNKSWISASRTGTWWWSLAVKVNSHRSGQIPAGGISSNQVELYVKQPSFMVDTNGNTHVGGNLNVSGVANLNTLNFTGNVGIGTSSPTGKLHISSGSSGDCELILESDTTNNSSVGDSYTPKILFRQDGANDWSMIGTDYYGDSPGENANALTLANSVNGGGGGIIFKTNSSSNGYTDAIERMKISPSGNVGIGTMSPSYKLDVRTTSSAIAARFGYTGGNSGGTGQGIVHITGEAEGAQAILRFGLPNGADGAHKTAIIAKHASATGSWSRSDLYFCLNNNSNNNNASENATTTHAKMIIKSDGNVGIGTTTPSYKLDVNGDINISGNGVLKMDGVVLVTNSNNRDGGDFYYNCRVIRNTCSLSDGMYINHDSLGGTAADCRFFANGTTQRMVIKANTGNVGIGTTSPTEKLHVAGNIKLTGNLITSSKTISQAELGYLDGVTSSIQTQINAAASSGGGAFTTSGNNCYFNGAGGVNIGENNAPSARLEINDSAGRSIRFGTGSSSNVHHMDYYSGNDQNNPFYINYYSGEDILICAGSQGGNVGIGTDDPEAKLDVHGSIRGGHNTDTTSYFGRAAIGYASYSDWGSFSHIDRASAGNYAMMQNSAGQVLLNSSLGQTIKFRNNNYDKMILLSNGNFGIGTTNPGNKLVVVGQTDSTTFNATSDMRYKENICPLENPLEKICQIQGVNFNFIEDEDENKKKHAGIIAQEVYKIIPEAIDTKNDDKWTANYNTFIGYLIESVKSLKKENDELKEDNVEKDKKINNLENKIENMATDISAIKEMLKM